MRVSVSKNDKGFVVDASNYEVFLNGEKLSNCFTADEELGEAHCYKEKVDFCEDRIEILKGKVEIKKVNGR